MDVHARHHQAHVDERRTEEPVEPCAPVLVERDHDDREHHAHHERDLNEALVAARTSPGGNGVEDIDDVLAAADRENLDPRSDEHTSELQSLMRISYAVFCLKKKNN